MNRRTCLRSLLALGGIMVTSWPFLHWIGFRRYIKADEFQTWQPLIADLAEVIIPTTDTPGAKDALVDVYILAVMLDCTNAREQHRFLRGLKELNDYSAAAFEKNFTECSLSERNQILQHFQEKSSSRIGLLNKVELRFFGEPFFLKLRRLAVEGYCQSQLGATIGLAYDYIPGIYEPCTSLNHNQKCWATK